MKPEKLKEKMKGVIIVQATPFLPDGSVDVEGLRENTRFLVDEATGKDFVLVPVGSTGEFYALSDEERKRVIKTVVDEANGQVPVLAGTAQAGTGETLRMSKYAEEVGADGVQIALPYYQLPSEEGMYQHYKTVAKGIGIGIMVYNNPAMTKAWIKPELMVRLSEIENIIADKENANDVVDYYWMQKLVDPSKMKIFCGLGGSQRLLEAMVLDPAWVKDMFDTAVDLLITAAEEMMGRGFKFDGAFVFDDMGYRNATLFSPAAYRAVEFPSQKRMCDFFKSNRMPVILHSCGCVREFAPLLIEAGFTCIQPLEVKAGMDLIELKKSFGDKLAFMGGIDVRAMAHPDPSVIEEEIKTKIPFAKKDGGYIYHSDHSVPSNVSFEQYCRVIELVREYGTY